MRLKMVEECLDWAYRSGYVGAESAAKEYADAHMLVVSKYDLGQYGDQLEFKSTADPTAASAVAAFDARMVDYEGAQKAAARHTCDACGLTFFSEGVLRLHVAETHGGAS